MEDSMAKLKNAAGKSIPNRVSVESGLTPGL